MSWILLSVLAAMALGVYDIFKKCSVRENAVIPILFVSVSAGALVWLPWMILSRVSAQSLPMDFLYVDGLSWLDHGRLFLKSAIVASSWILAYFALKHLPVSIASPIRATSPLWTLVGAIALFGERPNAMQWAGIVVTLVFFLLFSVAGRKEGIVFHRNRWVGFTIGATFLGAVSSLYDKFLLSEAGFTPSTVQAYFSLYLVVVLFPVLIGWLLEWWPRGQFEWRWSIPMIGFCLLVADYLYFSALTNPDSLVSVVSCIRRGSALIVFVAGFFLFGERNYRAKLPCLLGILIGIVLIIAG